MRRGTSSNRSSNRLAPTLAVTEVSSTQEYVTSAVTVIVGIAGIALAWAIYSERRIAIPAVPFWRRTLESKFYFDRLYEIAAPRPKSLLK